MDGARYNVFLCSSSWGGSKHLKPLILAEQRSFKPSLGDNPPQELDPAGHRTDTDQMLCLTGSARLLFSASIVWRQAAGLCGIWFSVQKKDEESAGGNRTGAGGKKASAAQLRIQKDINELNLPKTCEINFPDDDDLLNFRLIISPDEGFYKGGKFVFSFKVGQGYPHDPPKVKCETMVYHPNIDLEGNVCLNILREDWKPVLTINSIIYGLQYLFLEPNPEDPLNKEAAEVLQTNRRLFEQNVHRSLRGGYVGATYFERDESYQRVNSVTECFRREEETTETDLSSELSRQRQLLFLSDDCRSNALHTQANVNMDPDYQRYLVPLSHLVQVNTHRPSHLSKRKFSQNAEDFTETEMSRHSSENSSVQNLDPADPEDWYH
ncbi:NEDD8-conjugating enzyme Ubc12 isoform X1 [Lates japonicus]|uniref:NEDD8-conjugating enzyme UBC12 n=1 Tax=Lates japonicus TaxID=270547 RepID=A0AAD3NBN0_LATJO|nr:NEDD8-conjugating enzyme Ubc12 isoform X1 [Lates japonicus]